MCQVKYKRFKLELFRSSFFVYFCDTLFSVTVSYGGLRLNLTLEFVEGDGTILVVVEFLEDLIGLLLGHVETTALNDTLDLAGVDTAIRIQVKAVEGLNNVEVRVASESLSDGLGSDLNLEVHSPHVAELDLGVGEEAVVTSEQVVAMVRGTSVQHMSIVRILCNKGISELTKVKSVVVIYVVSSEEEINLISLGENTNSSETLSQIGLSDRTVTAMIKDGKCVVQVKVRLHGEAGLTVLKFALLSNQVTKALNQCVLFVRVQNGLARRSVGTVTSYWAREGSYG